MTGKEKVLDAYCGIGTIGMVASRFADKVTGVELNRDAVKDAIANAKLNDIKNCWFVCGDASEFMANMAAEGETAAENDEAGGFSLNVEFILNDRNHCLHQ